MQVKKDRPHVVRASQLLERCCAAYLHIYILPTADEQFTNVQGRMNYGAQ